MTAPHPTYSPIHRLSVALLAVAALTIFAAATAQAKVYKYVDRDGVSHYTDSVSLIPSQYRNQVKDITDDLSKMDGFRVIEGADGPKPAAPGAAEDGDEAGVDLPEFDLSTFDLGGSDAAEGLIEKWGFGLILLILLLIPVLWIVSGLVLKLSCRIAGEEPPGLGRACGILLAQSIVGGMISGIIGGLAGVMGVDENAGMGLAIGAGALSMILPWLASGGVLVSMMSYGFGKSLWICFLHSVLILVMIGVPVAGIGFVAMALG